MGYNLQGVIKVLFIETITDWNDLAKTLREFDYFLFQMQYDIDDPEGFHAVFAARGPSENIEVVTHSTVIRGEIMHYRPDSSIE